MNNDDNSNNNGQSPKRHYKLGDDLIAVIRELVQLSILTGTNVVDHFRAINFEIHEQTGKAVPTQDYMDAYSDMMEKLQEQAEQAQKMSEMQKRQGQVDRPAVSFDDSNGGDVN